MTIAEKEVLHSFLGTFDQRTNIKKRIDSLAHQQRQELQEALMKSHTNHESAGFAIDDDPNNFRSFRTYFDQYFYEVNNHDAAKDPMHQLSINYAFKIANRLQLKGMADNQALIEAYQVVEDQTTTTDTLNNVVIDKTVKKILSTVHK